MDDEMFGSFAEELEKIAGFGEAWDRFRDFFRPEAHRAKKDVAQHFQSKRPDKWDNFVRSAVDSPEFVKQLKRSKQSDDRLVLHAASMHLLANAPTTTEVESQGSSGHKYQIKQLPNGQMGCTCNDWRYKGSVNPGYECKHIKAAQLGSMKVAALKKKGPLANQQAQIRAGLAYIINEAYRKGEVTGALPGERSPFEKSSSFRNKTVAFFDELSKMRDQNRFGVEADRAQRDSDGGTAFSNLLTQDDEPSYYNPHPAQPVEEPEVILGGVG